MPRPTRRLVAPNPATYRVSDRADLPSFVARREYENLDDPALSAQFEDYRKAEARLLLSLLVSLGVVALIVLTVRYVA